MSKIQGQTQAIDRAKADLAGIDIPKRCLLLSLSEKLDNEIRFRAFGADYILNPESLELTNASNSSPMKPGDQIIMLHYLLCDIPVNENGEMITFRDMPGGQFYWEPFLSRSIAPLLKRIGNNIDILKTNLSRFDWQPFEAGDFAAKIHSIGKINTCLVYHLGDDEFPAAAEILFDSSVKRVFNSEDVAFIASRICIGLL